MMTVRYIRIYPYIALVALKSTVSKRSRINNKILAVINNNWIYGDPAMHHSPQCGVVCVSNLTHCVLIALSPCYQHYEEEIEMNGRNGCR
jgi:hypothetical protein